MNRRPSLTSHPSSRSVSRRYRTDTDAFFLPEHKRNYKKQLLRLFLFLFACILLGNLAANQFVFVSEVNVPISALASEWDGYTILSLSDLKGVSFGKNQGRLKEAIEGKNFDAVILSGDMISPLGNAQPFYDLLDVLREVNPEAPVYYIPGDTDPEALSMDNASSGSPYAQWVLGARQRGAVLLNAPVVLAEGKQSVWISAAADLTMDTQSQRERFRRLQQEADASGNGIESDYASYHLARISGLETARKSMKKDDVCICVTHTPPDSAYLNALRAPSGRNADLLICGHWLGGLTRLPVIGSLFIPTESLPGYGLFPGNAYCGLQRSGSVWCYYNTGLGNYEAHYPPFFRRLFNPPSAAFLHLTVSSL